MDRLVCGDVGYGKTEVAMRAAFKAVLDKKQVAVLVPTTVLASSTSTPSANASRTTRVNVEMLSRLRKAAEVAGDRSSGCVKGEVDVVIGTHKLLGKEIAFKDLGLLVVDEEQRFGVTHKERLKKLRKLGGRADAHRHAHPAHAAHVACPASAT